MPDFGSSFHADKSSYSVCKNCQILWPGRFVIKHWMDVYTGFILQTNLVLESYYDVHIVIVQAQALNQHVVWVRCGWLNGYSSGTLRKWLFSFVCWQQVSRMKVDFCSKGCEIMHTMASHLWYTQYHNLSTLCVLKLHYNPKLPSYGRQGTT